MPTSKQQRVPTCKIDGTTPANELSGMKAISSRLAFQRASSREGSNKRVVPESPRRKHGLKRRDASCHACDLLYKECGVRVFAHAGCGRSRTSTVGAQTFNTKPARGGRKLWPAQRGSSVCGGGAEDGWPFVALHMRR